MTTRRVAVEQLARLHKTYFPLVDKLVEAALSASQPAPFVGIARGSTVGLPTATADSVVLEEQRQAKLIWTLGETAWGPKATGLLSIHATPDEVRDIAHILELPLDAALHAAILGCYVRSKRLGRLLADSPPEPVHDQMRRAALRYAELVAEHRVDRADKKKQAAVKKQVADEIGCPVNTVRASIRRYGTVPS